MATDLADARSAWLGLAPRHALARLWKARPDAAARRAGVVGDSLGLFETCATTAGSDGYPRVAGILGGREIRLSFIPDSLAIKRLPQLWLSITLVSRRPLPTLVLTARPRGDDYVCLPASKGRPLAVPDWLPGDLVVRGGPEGQAALDRLRGPLESTFADPRIKEVATTAGRIHLLYRLSEGRRGMHLLFRECIFDDVLTRERLRHLSDTLLRLEGDATGAPAHS